MRILAAIFLGVLLAAAARAKELPDQRPMLRIEPGMHMAPIRRIGVDAACTLMATGSSTRLPGFGLCQKAVAARQGCYARCAFPSARAITARSLPSPCLLTASGLPQWQGHQTRHGRQ